MVSPPRRRSYFSPYPASHPGTAWRRSQPSDLPHDLDQAREKTAARLYWP